MEDINKFHNIKRAAILSIMAAFSFSFMALFAKLAAEKASSNTILLFRFGISFLYIMVILSFRKAKRQPFTLKTNHFGLHLLRHLTGLAGIFLFYYVLRYMPLLNASLLFTTYPLFVPILAMFALNIKTPKSIWIAIMVGFIGVAFVLQPNLDIFKHTMSLLALAAGFIISISALSLRKLSKTEHTYTIMFYYFLIAVIISGSVAIFTWKTPDPTTLIYLVLLGITGSVYQEFSVRAARHAPARITTTLMYLNIAFGGIFDWIFWHHAPNIACIIGVLLVFAGAILTVFLASRVNLYERIKK